MLPMKNAGSARRAAGRWRSDSGMCERAPLAHTAPWAISPASSTMRWRRVARTIGGSAPWFFAPASRSLTKRRMSSSGLPAWTRSRAWVGPWLTPMPKRKRPPDTSWMKAAVCAKSNGWRA